MAFVENQGARIYWDDQGHGPPVLLIMGLSYPSCIVASHTTDIEGSLPDHCAG
jgi:hypothetical protein